LLILAIIAESMSRPPSDKRTSDRPDRSGQRHKKHRSVRRLGALTELQHEGPSFRF
jgi:hypothetical protein